MTEKEKAKAYDKAIERTKKLYGNRITKEIFPELKEDDDEKIKKDLIQWVDEFPDTIWRGHYKNDIIAWLEKQGDKDKLIQELEEYKVKYTQEILEKHITSMSNKDDERLRKNTISFLREFAEIGYENAVECIAWLEKQGEDKKEISNFDVLPGLYKCIHRMFDGTPDGRLLFEIGNVYKCLSKHDRAEFEVSYGHSVYLEDPVVCKYFIPFESKDEQASLQTNERAWTIQDAKDGDVLVCDIDKAEIGGDVEKLPHIVSTIFIFKKLINSRYYIHSYCHLYDKRFLGLQRTMYYNSFVHNISPATKEQRDLLFQKIKEAGYEWDSEKKELKKK